MAGSFFYDTDQYHIITDTLSHLNSPSTISPGTLGSFLFGCTGDTYGDVSNKFCSPLCVGSLLPSKQSISNKTKPISPFTDFASPTENNDELCSVQVITIKGNKLFRDERSNVQSPNAYIFIEYPNTFNGFTRDQIYQLKQLGINTVSVYDIHERKHSVVVGTTSVDQLRINETPSDNGIVSVNRINTSNIPNSTNILNPTNISNSTNISNPIDVPNSSDVLNSTNISNPVNDVTTIQDLNTSNTVNSGKSWMTWIVVILVILLLLGLLIWGYNRYKNTYM